MYPETLRLLQDLCFHFLATPRAFVLQRIAFNRKDVIGRGGEIIAYSGRLEGHSPDVVVREVVMAPSEWESRSGRKVKRLIHREAITHSLLHHPNILPFLGIYHEDHGSPPLTIVPLIERGSLQKVLEDGPLSSHTLQRILLGVSRGVEYLHSRRPPIVHGDIHPGNILVDFAHNPYLCDFGMSRIRHEVTRTRTISQERGRERFMAPELFRRRTTSCRTSSASDIFSLAMTFLNAWSGQPPFSEIRNNRKAVSALGKGQRPGVPASGVALAPGVTKHLWELLCEMWAENPAKRPSSSMILVRLNEALNDQPHNPPLGSSDVLLQEPLLSGPSQTTREHIEALFQPILIQTQDSVKQRIPKIGKEGSPNHGSVSQRLDMHTIPNVKLPPTGITPSRRPASAESSTSNPPKLATTLSQLVSGVSTDAPFTLLNDGPRRGSESSLSSTQGVSQGQTRKRNDHLSISSAISDKSDLEVPNRFALRNEGHDGAHHPAA
ncbi:kinase-like protein [Clavulina sp. PMI_390]|nr:kinase-like protein [Clavulina sp. PMI_390]